MIVSKAYELWMKNVTDKTLAAELESIEDNDSEIYERFYRGLDFGTAGLRGIIGAGTNRMNIYTVRRATQGLAFYLKEKANHVAVAISYDSRINSLLFAKEAASVLAANDILVYITHELQPTPVLSFLTRRLGCKGGIMITASHNPSQYNGYKCYGEDGCQMTDSSAKAVYNHIQSIDMFKGVKHCDFKVAVEDGRIKYVDEKVYEDYLNAVYAQTVNPNVCCRTGLRVVYTPLNGAGNKLVRKILDKIKVDEVHVVAEQEFPDGNFPTCEYPNPEFKESLTLALRLASNVGSDIVLATDPDSDRVGVAVNNHEDYVLLSGNEIGILLTNYILMSKKMISVLPSNATVIKTIVSSPMVEPIVSSYGCRLINVLTGFKYIGEQISRLDEETQFVFGFEESYGYLAGTYVRDKDAVVASMLICEMAAYYKYYGKNLCEVLRDLYTEFGYYKSTTLNFVYEGSVGMQKIESIMKKLRHSFLKSVAGFNVVTVDDYKSSISYDVRTGEETEIKLPVSNVIVYSLEGGNRAIIRPSGTEPKLKLYITAIGETEISSQTILNKIASEFTRMVDIENE